MKAVIESEIKTQEDIVEGFVKTRDDKIALELPITIALSSIFGSDGAGATATEPRPVPKHVGCMTRTVTPADRFASCAGPMASSVNA